MRTSTKMLYYLMAVRFCVSKQGILVRTRCQTELSALHSRVCTIRSNEEDCYSVERNSAEIEA